nr:hypothetical protein BaRGS_017838 [Batillaria attramentaria]
MLALSVIFFWYYNTIMAWALYYAVASCQSVVPWSRHNALQVSSGMGEPGDVVWYLVLALVVSLLFIFCALVKGVKSAGKGGIYVFQLVDWYMATVTIFIVGVMECFGLAWVYGTDRFGDDIELMIGRRPPMIMRIFWCFITPVCLFVILVFLLTRYKPPTYGDYEYDEWASVFGWIIATVSFVPIPVVAVYQLYHAQGSFLQRLRQTTRPESSWGPADAKLRRQYQKELLQKPPRSSCLDIIRR